MVKARPEMTIQELYDLYQKRPDRALVVSDGKKTKLPKGSSMSWELAINESRVRDFYVIVFHHHANIPLYQKRVDNLLGVDSDLGGKKRKSSLDSSPVAKRSRTGM
jgi:hypothetical protein